MHRRLSQHDPERSWENDFESETDEQQSPAADIALEDSDFQPEPLANAGRQHPPQFSAREEGSVPHEPAAFEPDSWPSAPAAFEPDPFAHPPAVFEPDPWPNSPAALEPEPFSRETAALEADPFPDDTAPVDPAPILRDAAALEPAPLPSQPLSSEADRLLETAVLDRNLRLDTLRFDEQHLQFQHTPELEHRPRAVPVAAPVDDTRWIGFAARAVVLTGAILLLAFGAMWVLERDVRPPVSAPSPPPRESADAGLQSPPPVAVEPPVPAPGPDKTTPPADAAARAPAAPPSQTVEQPRSARVEPPPLKGTTVPPPALPPVVSEPAPSRALPPLVPATPSPSRTGIPTPSPAPDRGTAVESTPPPPARGAANEPTPAAAARGTAVESTPPTATRPAPPDPSPSLPRAAVDQPTLTPPPSPPSQPLSPPAPSAAPGPSATAASAPAAVDIESSAIRDVLGRYRNAFNSLDARAAQQVWPTVNSRTLDRAFGQLREQNVSFDKCTIDVKDIIAAASCNGTTRFVPRVGNQSAQTQLRQWNFILRKASSGGWHIQEVQAR